MPDSSLALPFLQTLWPAGIPAGHSLLIWRLLDRSSFWYVDLGEAATFAENQSNGDVYIGAGLTQTNIAEAYGRSNRTSASDITMLPALWADIDYGAEGHKPKGKKHPDTEEQALELPQSAGLGQPDIVVRTGYGLHVWYVFEEPWALDSDEMRERAALTMQRFQLRIRQEAQKNGWTIDSTHDLARVLRIPGTLNHKIAESALPVWAEYHEQARQSWADWEQRFKEVEIMRTVPKRRTHVPVNSYEVPYGIIDELNAVDDTFQATWLRKRKDILDNSASGYDLAIATRLAAAGATDEQIIGAMYRWRQRHGENPAKLERGEYTWGTIRLARDRHLKSQHQELQHSLEELGISFVKLTKQVTPDDVTWMMTVMTSDDPPHPVDFHLPSGWVQRFGIVVDALANHAGVVPLKTLKMAEWMPLSRQLVKIAQVQYAPHPLHDPLEEYLHNPLAEDAGDAWVKNTWWKDDEYVYILEWKFWDWLSGKGPRRKKSWVRSGLQQLGWIDAGRVKLEKNSQPYWKRKLEDSIAG